MFNAHDLQFKVLFLALFVLICPRINLVLCLKCIALTHMSMRAFVLNLDSISVLYSRYHNLYVQGASWKHIAPCLTNYSNLLEHMRKR